MDVSVEPLQRHIDERGWVSEVDRGQLGEDLRNIHLGNLKPGHVRGNHLHRESREWIVFFGGPLRVRFKQGGQREDKTLREPSLIRLQPGVAHAFENTGSEPLHFVAYRDRPYDEENPDVVTVPLLEGGSNG